MSDTADFEMDQHLLPPEKTDLQKALAEGNPEEVRALVEAGADIHYIRFHGHNALLDALQGRDVARDRQLLDVLALLVEYGVNLSAVNVYEQSGLRILSRHGRFDAVRFLLEAGADKSQLEWTPLMEAVALGSIADVQAALAGSPVLEARDWWSRTAWLIAVLIGDTAKAKLLRESGADVNARGQCSRPPLFYAIQGRQPVMLRWLIQHGADIHQVDEHGTTALIEAVQHDDLECVEVLLEQGAAIQTDVHGTALSRALSRDIILRLLDAGADPADANQRIILGLPMTDDGEPDEQALATASKDDFRRAPVRSFGKANPERMNVPFWEAMIRAGASAYSARARFEEKLREIHEPIWCAQRFGQSLTLLPDGRAIQVAGEHEDSYDPDFCIYNDVFVHEPDGSIAIYGYPESVFPPTDFHTATLIGDFIYLIGSLGYRGARRFGETQLYRLDIRSLRIDRLDARGEAPGWIYEHRAVAVDSRTIRVWGGKTVTEHDGEESHEPNQGVFVLDVDRLLWRRESVLSPSFSS